MENRFADSKVGAKDHLEVEYLVLHSHRNICKFKPWSTMISNFCSLFLLTYLNKLVSTFFYKKNRTNKVAMGCMHTWQLPTAYQRTVIVFAPFNDTSNKNKSSHIECPCKCAMLCTIPQSRFNLWGANSRTAHGNTLHLSLSECMNCKSN